MNPPEAYKLLGPIAFSIAWLTIAFLVYNWRGDKSMSISKRAAAHKSAFWMMLVAESVIFPMFFLFAVKWIAPTFNLPPLFTVFVGVSFIGFLLAAYIPDKDGWQRKVHALCAYGASLIFIPTLTILYLSPNVSSFARNFSLFAVIYQLVAVTLFATFENAKNHHLYFQGVYFLLFDLSMLAAAYIR